MREQIILVANNDGDVIMGVRPIDPLNPRFCIMEIEKNPDLHTEIINVHSFADFLQTQEPGYR